MTTQTELLRALAQPDQPTPQIPVVLFDGYAVLQALSEKAKARTSAENVSDVLDAVVGILRASPAPPQAEQAEAATIKTWHKNGDQHADLMDWGPALDNLPDGLHKVYLSPAADSKSDHTALLRMLCMRARSFPNFPMGYHMPEVFKAVGEEPPEPADSKDAGAPVATYMRVTEFGSTHDRPVLHKDVPVPKLGTLLYTRPQAADAQPLTETQVYGLQCAVPDGTWFDAEQAGIFERGIRAAERAHGITGKDNAS